MKSPNRLLGFEWDTDAVTIAVVTRTGPEPALERLVRVAVPDSVGDDPAGRGAWLGQILAEHRISPGPAVAALPRGSTLWRRLTLPPGVGEDRDALLEFQARRELPLPLEEVHAAWAPDTDGTGATLAAARREIIQAWAQTYGAAGCPLAGCVPSAVAALAAARANGNAEGGATFLVDVGARESEISFVASGSLQLVRTASVGGAHPDLADRLGGEILRTHRTVADTESRPLQVWLTSKGENGLAPALAERCGLQVEPLPSSAGRFTAPEGDALPGWVAIGAAVSGLQSEGPRIDLLRPIVGAARPRARKIGRNAVLAAAGVALLALLIVPGVLVDQRESEANRLAARATALEKKEVAEVNRVRDQRRLLLTWTSERAHWIEVIKAVAESVPAQKQVYLDSLTLREGQPLRAHGFARSLGDVQQFIAVLEKHPRFSEVTPRKQDRLRKTRPGGYKWDFSVESKLLAGPLPDEPAPAETKAAE